MRLMDGAMGISDEGETMTETRELTLADIADQRAYERERDEFRDKHFSVLHGSPLGKL